MVSKVSNSSVTPSTQIEFANDAKVRHSLNARSTISSEPYTCFSCLTFPFRLVYNVVATILGWVKRRICGEDLEELEKEREKEQRFESKFGSGFFDDLHFEDDLDHVPQTSENGFGNNSFQFRKDWKANAEQNNWRFEELPDDYDETKSNTSGKGYHVEEPDEQPPKVTPKQQTASSKIVERFFVKEIESLINSLIQPGIFLRVDDSCDAVAVLRINKKTHILYQEKNMQGESFNTFCGRTINWLESQTDRPLDANTELMLKVVLVEKKEQGVKFSVFTEYRDDKNQNKLEPTYETINSNKARDHNMTLFSMDTSGVTAAKVANFFNL